MNLKHIFLGWIILITSSVTLAQNPLDFLTQGNVSGGVRYQLGGDFIIDGSYTTRIAGIETLNLYNVTALKAQVVDGDLGAGAMTGFGAEYISAELALFGEIRVNAIYTYGVSPSLAPEVVIGFAAPLESLW